MDNVLVFVVVIRHELVALFFQLQQPQMKVINFIIQFIALGNDLPKLKTI